MRGGVNLRPDLLLAIQKSATGTVRVVVRSCAPGSMTERLLITARDGIYKDFMARMRPAPTDRMLDVGVSDVINDGANVLERAFPYPHNITAAD